MKRSRPCPFRATRCSRAPGILGLDNYIHHPEVAFLPHFNVNLNDQKIELRLSDVSLFNMLLKALRLAPRELGGLSHKFQTPSITFS